jgi:hypothetical protein
MLPNATDGAMLVTVRFASWNADAPLENLKPSSDRSSSQYLDVALLNTAGFNFDDERWPNVTYAKDGSLLRIAVYASTPLFLRLWVRYFVDDDVDPSAVVGNLTVSVARAPMILNINKTKTLTLTMSPNETAFASWDFGWFMSDDLFLMSWVQVVVECDPPDGEEEAKPMPIRVYAEGCKNSQHCSFPKRLAMESILTTELSSPFGPGNASLTYSLGYPNYSLLGPSKFSALISLYNNNSRTCRVNVDTYAKAETKFDFQNGKLTNLTSDVIALLPRRYEFCIVSVEGQSDPMSNMTVFFRLIPKNVRPNATWRLALLYHEFRAREQQDLISAEWILAQTRASDVLETAFVAHYPYQSFAIYNLGDEEASFYLELSKNPDSSLSALFWTLISLLIVSLVLAPIAGYFAWSYYKRRQNYVGYSVIPDSGL